MNRFKACHSNPLIELSGNPHVIDNELLLFTELRITVIFCIAEVRPDSLCVTQWAH